MGRSGPDLKRFMDRKLVLYLNGKRTVRGLLRGYDQFMNLVLEEAVEVVNANFEKPLPGMVVIRGNSVENFEVLWTEQT
ncbi:small nuclear ribonucleoprotein polypeptide G [Tribonema minus]|uniref:Small nuclear ribonucleoprotein G n=1 Tax=Tribonema minus TaxID=303371 RepID=A0A835YWC8_9STRA|nr:small nuclear ribonucleoprotein polypeptide G [Tribonema minus]